jgi:hypothetical protein
VAERASPTVVTVVSKDWLAWLAGVGFKICARG